LSQFVVILSSSTSIEVTLKDIQDIHDLSANQRITLNIKVISLVKEAQQITSKEVELQMCFQWENNVNKMENEECYILTAGERTAINVTNDIGEVADVNIDVGETKSMVKSLV
jgi:hypothetical protein